MKENKIKKELVINTIIIGIGKFSTQIVSFLLLPLYTSILTTEEYGTYDLILTIITFLLPFITLLMEESLFRFLIDCDNEENKKKVISQTIIYILFSTSIFIFFTMIISHFVEIPYKIITIIYIVSWIFSSLRNSLVRGLGKIKLYTFVNFFTSLINIIFNICFIVILKWGIAGLLLAGIISNVSTTIIVFMFLKMHRYCSIKSFDKELMKKMIRYSIPLVPNSLSWAVVNLSDRVIISGSIGASANGIYAMAYKFPNLMNTIYSFFYTAWTESSAKAVKDKESKNFFNSIYKVLTKLMFSFSLAIIVCMPLIFKIFFKLDYIEAYYYVPILVIAMYYSNMSGYYGGIFSGHKDTKIMGTTTIIGAMINLVIDILFIRFIGIYAAALSTLISCIIIYYYRKSKVKKYVTLDNVNLNIEWITMIMTLILYYYNTKSFIKILNFIIVVIVCIYSNKEIVYKILAKVKQKN